MIRWRTSIVAPVLAGLAAGVIAAGAAASQGNTTLEAESGLSQGGNTSSPPASAVQSPTNAPSGMISVITTSGATAYVYADELEKASGGDVANPEAAADWMAHLDDLRAQGVKEILIPAYLKDGETVVGEFAIGVPSDDPAGDIPVAELCEVFADDPWILEDLLAGRTCPDAD